MKIFENIVIQSVGNGVIIRVDNKSFVYGEDRLRDLCADLYDYLVDPESKKHKFYTKLRG